MAGTRKAARPRPRSSAGALGVSRWPRANFPPRPLTSDPTASPAYLSRSPSAGPQAWPASDTADPWPTFATNTPAGAAHARCALGGDGHPGRKPQHQSGRSVGPGQRAGRRRTSQVASGRPAPFSQAGFKRRFCASSVPEAPGRRPLKSRDVCSHLFHPASGGISKYRKGGGQRRGRGSSPVGAELLSNAGRMMGVVVLIKWLAIPQQICSLGTKLLNQKNSIYQENKMQR